MLSLHFMLAKSSKNFSARGSVLVVSKKPDAKRWNFLWNFRGAKTVELTVEIPREIPQNQNLVTFCGISTERTTETKPWNFHRKLHGFVSVGLSVEIPRFSLKGTFPGNLTGNSTVLSRASWMLPQFF